ncbi:MAG: DNA internalization-related competence protein ComEC/Rec2 [Peptococcaceae bacterium]|nr:DNA internalization-related competence protein ComEC/Rec2 [Peptococcaceae bacterium]
MVSRPLVYLTLAFSAGIALAGIAALPPWGAFLAALAVTVAAGVILLVLRRDVFPVLLAVFFLLGAAVAAPEAPEGNKEAERFLGRTVTVEGFICREPEVRGDRTVCELEVRRVYQEAGVSDPGGRVLLYIPGRRPDLDYGDEVRVKGRPYLPDSPGNPGQFDYGGHLAARGIWGLVSVKDRDSVEKISTGGGNPIAGAALGIKRRLMEVTRATLEPDHAALVNGVVFGSRGEISPRAREIFNEAGVIHILSVSGLHVGLVAAGVLGLLGLTGLQRFGFPVLTAVLPVYVYITGMGPAVLRAALMAWIQLLGRRLGRERDWPTTLAASALIILVISPRSLFEPGFQLSFAATWGILHIGPLIDRRLEAMGLARPWVRGCLAVPLGAQVGTLPLVAYYYNLLSLISIPANLLAVPLVGLILPLGLVAALAGLVHVKIALLINYATAALLDLMMLTVGLIHSLPGGVVYVPPPPAAAMAAWYISLAFLAGAAGQGKKAAPVFRKFMAGLLAFSLVLSFMAAVWPGRGDLQVYVIDVGQGDSILVRFPNGRSMLVDAGGWKDEFREGRGAGEVVAAYLRRLGIRKIDALVLTHPHEDHAAGAGFLTGRFDIGKVLVSPAGYREETAERADPAYGKMLAAMDEKNIPVREVISGDVLTLDPLVAVEVLGPGAALLTGTRSDLNNNSVVLSIRYGWKSFLLTGDIEEAGQARLVEGGFRLRHSVLKVPHHGSRYVVPEFIYRVKPDLSVISVGRNSFGQPDPGTVALAGAEGKPVYRTDRDGLVVFSCDGRRIRVDTGKHKK